MDLISALAKIKEGSHKFAVADDDLIEKALYGLADLLRNNTEKIIKANQLDLNKISESDPIYDRVHLNEDRIEAMAKSVIEIADYDSPVGVVIEHRVLANGLDLKKISTPIGVVGVIFEARPNVVIDIFALCFKSKNACVMKGGSQSENSNVILVELIKEAAKDFSNVVELLPNDRELVAQFLKADTYVDVIIPRGGQELINFVRKSSLIPVIETGAGVVHTYFDEFADLKKGVDIIFNAKVSRPSVCNALDTLIVHRSRLEDLGEICRPLEEKKVEIYADEEAFKVLDGKYSKDLLFRAESGNFGMEYLSLKMAIKTVDSLDKAIIHINRFGSGHSEAIVTENGENAEKFLSEIDAACVYVNASTRFTDGGEFGMGAEVGISTQKLHARGPMGIKELTSYKWQIVGNGQVRN